MAWRTHLENNRIIQIHVSSSEVGISDSNGNNPHTQRGFGVSLKEFLHNHDNIQNYVQKYFGEKVFKEVLDAVETKITDIETRSA